MDVRMLAVVEESLGAEGGIRSIVGHVPNDHSLGSV